MSKHLTTSILFLLVLLGSYFLFSDGLSQETTRSTRALWNLGHVLYFSLFTLAFIRLPYAHKLSYLKLCFIVIVSAIIIGTGIEALQYGTARSTDLTDVANDVLGSLIILVFYRPLLPNIKTRTFKAFKGIVLLLCLISLWPLASAVWDESHAKLQFPILADFSSSLEIKRWTGNSSYSISTDKNNVGVMKIKFNTQRYSGVHLKYFEHDWSDYQNLNMTLYNPEQKNLAVTLRIHDLKHKPNFFHSDRFNRRLTLYPGVNEIKLPLNDVKNAPKKRLMELNNIDGFGLFTTRLQQSRELYLKSIYLSH